MIQGREDILAGLRDVASGFPGRGGVACLLSGAAGMGKTHLAQRFMGQLPSDTAKLVGAVSPTGTPPLMPICRALASDLKDPLVCFLHGESITA